MAHKEVNTSGGLYMIDFELVDNIIFNSYFFKSLNDNAKKPVGDNNIVWNTDTARAKADGNSAILVHRLLIKFKQVRRDKALRMSSLPPAADIEELREELRLLEKAGRDAIKALKQKKDQTARTFMKKLERKVSIGKMGVELSKFVRDTSIDCIMVLSVPATFGASTALAAAGGGMLKGAAKWQDTGNLGAGMMQAGLTFSTALIPGTNKILVFAKDKIELTGNTALGIVEGKSVSESVISAVTSMGMGKLFGGAKDNLFPDANALVRGALIDSKNVDALVITNVSLVNSGFDLAKGKLSAEMMKLLSVHTTRKPFKNDELKCVVKADWAVLGPNSSKPVRWVSI